MLHVEDAQLIMKQAKRKLKEDDYLSLVDKIWKKKNNETESSGGIWKQQVAIYWLGISLR